jgi:hypothetical protein
MKTKIDITNTIVSPKGYYILEDQETLLNKDDLYWNGKSWTNMIFLNINNSTGNFGKINHYANTIFCRPVKNTTQSINYLYKFLFGKSIFWKQDIYQIHSVYENEYNIMLQVKCSRNNDEDFVQLVNVHFCES